ncbi:hypothetical protein ONS95_008177 [Cadophora gregata]|uniref:uncharacterized protein n=1 Tax=Cadophora gregata TaxID=51156 RepID=UPI0026DCD09F|nr:uncharacterized protein ONS95_008177 [Cadophora gregata]KAK0119335.1 hypothetical protein ONS96_012388 [Cadophora gregata f. sp. sojae]KAK0126589.1 hypothetical protein ONS95_008177 [Cadophora gregata]
MSTPSLKPLGESLGTELVTIHVGKKRKEFVIHKKLICDKVDYFQKAFQGNFLESNGAMYLADETPGAFALFIDWLYKSNIVKHYTRTHFINLVNLYILSEKICLNDLGNRAMDRIREIMYDNEYLTPTPALVCYIYDKTPQGSPIRDWSVRSLAYDMWVVTRRILPDKEDLQELSKYLRHNGEVFVDFFAYLGNLSESSRDNVPLPNLEPLSEKPNRSCVFHRHAEGEKSYFETVERLPVSDWNIDAVNREDTGDEFITMTSDWSTESIHSGAFAMPLMKCVDDSSEGNDVHLGI